jgi:hypothetical protein
MDTKANCGCAAHIMQMNCWGTDGCVKNIDTIVKWLYDEALARESKMVRLPFIRLLIKRFVLAFIG